MRARRLVEEGYYEVRPDKLATVVTCLEMRRPPAPRPTPQPEGIAIARLERPALARYRDLFRRVGSEWLWFSRLVMADEQLTAILENPRIELWALQLDGADEGLLELDHRHAPDCELSFFGVTAGLIGRGAGRLLMNHAIARAFATPIARLWVHTCTFDHPQALGFYIRSGFVPYRRAVEIASDPRLTGELAPSVAPHVPIIGAVPS